MKTIKLLTVFLCISFALIWTLPLGALAQQKPIKIGGSLAITGPLAELFYVQPFSASADEPRAYRPEVQPEKYLVHKRQKGEVGTTLKELTYVKLIKLGDEALEEGKQKAKSYRPGRPSQETTSK